jgi:Family of unknown function (DUF6527)
MPRRRPVAQIRRINDHGDRYQAIVLWCPGCEYTDEEDGKKYGGLHMLPVTGTGQKRPVWGWNGDLEKVTLNPSILTHYGTDGEQFTCHSFLRDGQWQFLGDCTHALAGQTVPMLPLPAWVTRRPR